MSEWDGRERRDYTSLRAVIREELEGDRKDLREMKQKMAQWEAGAYLFRWFVIATAATLTAGAGVLDWVKEHLK